jgi:transmembrane sensor
MNYTEQDRLEAAEWFIDIHDVEDPSPDLLHDWMRWMEESESHRSAFGAVERAWRDAAALAPADWSRAATAAATGDGDDYDGSVSIDAWLARPQTVKARRGPKRRRARNRRSGAWLAIAAAAALGATALVLAPRLQHRMSEPAAAETFATRTGEQIQVTLPDGSQVSLGARSKLTVAYTRGARDVRLEAGEAFFAVQKNAARPFRVHVLDGVVTAVGTAFDVRRTNDRVLVAVAEGVVQVNDVAAAAFRHPGASAPGGPERPVSPVASLRRGEAISFLSRPGEHTLEPAAVTRVDPAEPARWRAGWLVYRDEPLRDVLTDIARYTDRDIVVDGNLALSSHFTGAVFKDSIIEWLESLPAAFPVSVTASGSRILVAPASQAQPGHGP